jgi:hypothetical protein
MVMARSVILQPLCQQKSIEQHQNEQTACLKSSVIIIDSEKQSNKSFIKEGSSTRCFLSFFSSIYTAFIVLSVWEYTILGSIQKQFWHLSKSFVTYSSIFLKRFSKQKQRKLLDCLYDVIWRHSQSYGVIWRQWLTMMDYDEQWRIKKISIFFIFVLKLSAKIVFLYRFLVKDYKIDLLYY